MNGWCLVLKLILNYHQQQTRYNIIFHRFLDIEDLKEDAPNSQINDIHKIESLERVLKEKDAHIEQLLEQINQMKNCFHAYVERSGNGSKSAAGNSHTECQEESENGVQSHVAKIPIYEDESYFMTYAHFDIHYAMLSVS